MTAQAKKAHSNTDRERRCRAAWARFEAEGRPADLAGLRQAAVSLEPYATEPRVQNIGRFRHMDAWVLDSQVGRVALPLAGTEEILASSGLETRHDFWDNVAWFHPAYMTNGTVAELQRAVRAASPADRERALTVELARLYTPPHLASMLLDRYPELPDFQEFLPLIRETCDCYYLGRKRAAVASLVPVVEGVLAKFLGRLRGSDVDLTGAELLRQAIRTERRRAADDLIFHGLWVPPEYREQDFLERVDEYIYLLASFERFGQTHLFQRTDRFAAAHNLNRHGILHGRWVDFGRAENFYRLWSILDLLAFAITMGTSGVSVFAPERSPQAIQLAAQYSNGRFIT